MKNHVLKTGNRRKSHPVDCVIESYTFLNGNVSFVKFVKTDSHSNLINLLRASEAMWPVAQECKSPVGKAANVGVQIPFRANFLLFF